MINWKRWTRISIFTFFSSFPFVSYHSNWITTSVYVHQSKWPGATHEKYVTNFIHSNHKTPGWLHRTKRMMRFCWSNRVGFLSRLDLRLILTLKCASCNANKLIFNRRTRNTFEMQKIKIKCNQKMHLRGGGGSQNRVQRISNKNKTGPKN